MRALYTFLWHLARPWLPLRLSWRARREPGYGEHLGERFGRFGAAPPAPVVWVHAVSLGETHAARPLVARLLAHYPRATILLTHMTATGRAAGRSLGDGRIVQSWLPYDMPRYVAAFFDRYRPAAGIVLETELWPNLLCAAHDRGIPVFLVNARLSSRSAARYARVKSLAHETLQALAGVAAQTADDASRLAALGAPPPIVTGNLKFDAAFAAESGAAGAALRESLGRSRPVWLAASTREGEEALVLDAIASARVPADALLVLVPRHPQRFDAVASILAARGVPFVRRSAGQPVPRNVTVVLGDTMGEMAAYCIAADVVLMGGGLLELGGQNLIEPIAAGKPTVVGPHMYNFAAATEAAVAAGAALQAQDARAAVAAVAALLRDPVRRDRMRSAALAFHSEHVGATDRLWAWLAPQLDAALATAGADGVNPPGGG